MEVAECLKIISKAWGRQKGYCFFPTISGSAKDKPERIMSYKENPAFKWPGDKEAILKHMEANRDNDLYWCPMLFEYPKRQVGVAMDEQALWADLDEADPRNITDYPPTTAWQTSPGRYQALWLIAGPTGAMLGAASPGRENQKLTYHLGADHSGWDITQLLRVPGWDNHKPEYRGKDGTPAPGKLLWKDRRQYMPDEFGDLPDVESGTGGIGDILEDAVEAVDRLAVWARVKLKCSKRVRELVGAREVAGDRSDALWEIERDLADAGCSAVEIIAIVRTTVWNKYSGRSDEFRRLATEASKAIAQKSDDAVDAGAALEEIRERGKPQNLFDLVKNLVPPKWLIRGVLTQGAVGFIAGAPKSFKSWCALDMGLSVASGQPFLGHFDIAEPGPVLYIQEEDSGPQVKNRLGKVWPGKLGDKVAWDPENPTQIVWLPGQEVEGNPPINAYIGQGLVLSDEVWQLWLDETLEEQAATGAPYKLVIIDTLMMVAGDVEENRAQEMTTKIFRPLKELARKHGCSIQVVHHMRKADPKAGPMRGGQMMLGSVANHAWAEDSMYFRLGRGGDIICEQESKNAQVDGFRLTGIRNKRWTPQVIVTPGDSEPEPQGADGQSRKGTGLGPKSPRTPRAGMAPGEKTTSTNNAALKALAEMTQASCRQVADAAGVSTASVYQGFKRHEEKGWVEKVGTQYRITSAGIKALES